MTKNHAAAKQALVLTGLGYDRFEKGVKAVIEFHSHFANLLPAGSMEAWQPIADQDNLCLEFSNRYLTPDRLASVYETASFDEVIDPFGMFRGKGGGTRTEDNVVLYYDRLPTSDKS